MLSPEGYANRIYAIEWHARLWLQNGTPKDVCEAMMRHCTECCEADFYGEPRPQTTEEWPARMEAYFDKLFTSKGNVVSFD